MLSVRETVSNDSFWARAVIRRDPFECLCSVGKFGSFHDFLGCALAFYHRSVEAEQSGGGVFVDRRPRSSYDTRLFCRDEDLKVVHFGSAISSPSFKLKYALTLGDRIRHLVDANLKSINVKFGGLGADEIRGLSIRLGKMPYDSILERALDRFAVAMEYRYGLGLFNSSPHDLYIRECAGIEVDVVECFESGFQDSSW